MVTSVNKKKSFLSHIGRFFTKLGQSLMLPIAVLPIAGILLRLGQPDLLNMPFISASGDTIFSNLPILFALGIALGFSKDAHGAVVLSAFIGITVFNKSLEILNPALKMGVFAGIFIGTVTAYLYNKYSEVQFPQYLAFFGGKRFIPILTGFSSIVLAALFSIIWAPIGSVISSVGNFIIETNNIGLFIYGTLNRLLLPLGLHHILNSLFWFQFGEFTNAAGQVINGDLNRYFAGDDTAGRFMAGFFPIMMFGLPGAALAMVVTAKAKKRALAIGILLSAAFTSFLTGVTEPLEFSFMFLAFPLYVIHALLTGVSMVVMNVLDIKLGFGFSAGFFDYALSGKLGNNPWSLIPVGIVFFVIYFVLFLLAIKFFNIKSLGREDNDTNNENYTVPNTGSNEITGAAFVQALGGKENIEHLSYCTTRLRIDVKDANKVNKDGLKKLGAIGVIISNEHHVQVVIGTHVESIAEKIKPQLGKASN